MTLELQPVFSAHARPPAAAMEQASRSDNGSRAEGLDNPVLNLEYQPFRNLIKHIDRISTAYPETALELAKNALTGRHFTVPGHIEKLEQKVSELLEKVYPERALNRPFTHSVLGITPVRIEPAEPVLSLRAALRPGSSLLN